MKKEIRAAAKAAGGGGAEVEFLLPNGSKEVAGGALDPLRLRFLRLAAAMVFCPETRELPDLETFMEGLLVKYADSK